MHDGKVVIDVWWRPIGMAERVKKNTQQGETFTSCAVVCQRFEQVKGRRGAVLHREELADPAGCWRGDASHLAIQDRLKMAALTPQQGGDVPGGKRALN